MGIDQVVALVSLGLSIFFWWNARQQAAAAERAVPPGEGPPGALLCGAGRCPAVFHLSLRSASHQPIPPTPIARAKQVAIQNRMSASACDISVQRLPADAGDV